MDPVTHFEMSPYVGMDNNLVLFADPSGADVGYTLSWQANQAYLNNSLGSSSNWGQSVVGGNPNEYVEDLVNNATAFSTTNSSEIGSFIGAFARGAGFSRYSYIELDSSASGGIGGGFIDYKNKYVLLRVNASITAPEIGGGLLSYMEGGALLKGANLARELAVVQKMEGIGIKSYSALKTMIKNKGLQSHHLIEQRFANIMREVAAGMKSIAVTNAEHQIFTNAWRAEIG